MTTLTAFALIFDKAGKLLLCRRKKDRLWNLPGGHVEPKETPWDAVAREVREEISLKVDVLRLLGVYMIAKEDELVFSFVCAPRSKIPRPSGEIDAIDWFQLDRLPADIREHHDVVAKDALIPETVVMRVQR
jgi:ADP-ribose pyrophosphatase YjhB (NUDIX family)